MNPTTENPNAPEPDSDSGSVICANCGTTLIADAVAGSISRVRCFQCGNIWTRKGPATDPGIRRDHSAWWSLWLGMASIVFLCFAGVPAMYLGVRSLMRMRHQRTRTSDRAAAITGTALGVFFGLAGGLCFGSVVVAFMFGRMTTTQTVIPAEINAMVEPIAKIDLPDNYVPVSGQRFYGNQTFIRYADNPVIHRRKVFIRFVYYPPILKGAASSISATLSPESFTDHTRQTGTGEYDWSMCGSIIKVTRQDFEFGPVSAGLPHPTMSHYSGHSAIESGIYGLSVSVHSGQLSDDEVRQIFAAVQPPG